MPLTLRLKAPLTLPIDATPLQLEMLEKITAKDAAQLLLWQGNRQVALGELFEVAGSAEDQMLEFIGDCSRISSIGAKHRHGLIRVIGNAGPHCGTALRGGELQVTGDAGDWLGAEMTRGRITVFGNTADHVGGAYPGAKKGMTGGEILIHGRAGNELGARQRRGLIAVAGDTGAACGYGMIAGTILIGGRTGERCGAGMKRGTIILLTEVQSPSPTLAFRYATTSRPTFLQLYLKHLAAAGFPIEEPACTAQYQTFRGDFLELGKGEILTRSAAS